MLMGCKDSSAWAAQAFVDRRIWLVCEGWVFQALHLHG
jgi:hypothetical protein